MPQVQFNKLVFRYENQRIVSLGDGTSGMLAMMGILDLYSQLLDRKGVEISLNPPKPSVEELTLQQGSDKDLLLAKMVKDKADRATNYKSQLPFDMNELKENNSLEVSITPFQLLLLLQDDYIDRSISGALEQDIVERGLSNSFAES